eukprot:COSAG02_NODE_1492_length_12334_cov_29.721945_12_plen_135_part_00
METVPFGGVRDGSASTHHIKLSTAQVWSQHRSAVEIHELHGLPRDTAKVLGLGILVGRVIGIGRLLRGRRAVATEAERGRKRSQASMQPQTGGDTARCKVLGQNLSTRICHDCRHVDAAVYATCVPRKCAGASP